MTGSCDKEAGTIQVIFLDQGVGIPATLPRSTWWERVREKLGLFLHHDGEMIRAAMAIGRTGTAVQGRGKGLAQIRRFVEVSGGGRLRIFSGRGEYLYGTKEGERVTAHRSPFSGTLIEWEVPLEFWRGE